MAPKRETTAKREGFKVLQDQDLLNGVENRARQLEAERASHQLFRTEAAAVRDEAAVEELDGIIAKLETRLEVVHKRRDALKANMDRAPDGDGSATTAPTP